MNKGVKYRTLEPHETIKRGDQLLSHDGNWAFCQGSVGDKPAMWEGTTFRRPLTTAPKPSKRAKARAGVDWKAVRGQMDAYYRGTNVAHPIASSWWAELQKQVERQEKS